PDKEPSRLVLLAGSYSQPGGPGARLGGDVFVLDMGEPVRIVDLAHRMVRLYGLTVRDQDHPDGDIEIHVSGLRPGEKLYEELLIGGDVTETEHPRILKARERDIPYAELMVALDALMEALAANDRPAIVAMLQQLVPEYQTAPAT
ncbi:MAG: polysaccharide biosynthesis protein, partial [Halothiobacillus sp.]|nr:polysaccharide biosynthesis protein [Halothiobacillus sp.]